MHKAVLFKKTDTQNPNILKCLACRHYCTICDGALGKCKTRANIKGELYSLVYGKNTGIQIDPIEKKPLLHFLPGSDILSFGTIGCNFTCEFCQNWVTTQSIADAKHNEIEYVQSKIDKLCDDATPQEIVNLAVKNKTASIAYTYNEPGIFFEYAYDTAKLASSKRIKNVFVTNGYSSKEAVDLIAPFLNAANIDLKGFRNEFYNKICGANLEQVLDSIKYYYKKKIWIELTTLLIPGKNDSKDEIRDIANFIKSLSKDIPWHISRFSGNYKMNEVPPTDIAILQGAYEIGKDEGLNYVYAGNIFGDRMQSTYCPKCNELLIKRDWGQVEVKNLINGKCKFCKEKIPGIWG